jgi:hypothetical protein
MIFRSIGPLALVIVLHSSSQSVIAAANHDFPESGSSSSNIVVRRGLKMGMMSKKSPKFYDNNDVAQYSTFAPSVSLAPSAPLKSSKKKEKKKKKSEKAHKSKKSKKIKKSKKESSDPSMSPAPVFIPNVNQTTTAPVILKAPTNTPVMPTTIPTNVTGAPISVTIPPSVTSKSKKSKKGKGGSDSKQYRSRGDLPTASPVPSFSFYPSISSSFSDAFETLSPSIIAKPRPSHRSKSTAVPVVADLEYDAVSASPEPSPALMQIPLSQFQVTYSVVSVTSTAVSTENLMEVVDNTFLFINNFLASSFGAGNQIAYESLIGFHTAHSTDFKTIQFMATAQFLEPSNAATFIPNTSDLDLLLQRAFNQPTVKALLLLLQNLPVTNPFSQATEVQYALVAMPTSAPSNKDQSSDAGARSSVATTTGIAGAIFVAVFITGLVAFYRRGMFDKKLIAKKEPKYSKASEKENDVEQRNNTAPKVSNVDDKSCSSDWTSSVGSVPPSSSSSNIDDTGYRSHIIEEDVEIKFIYPRVGGISHDPYTNDPLFPQSPLISDKEKGRKKRHNI